MEVGSIELASYMVCPTECLAVIGESVQKFIKHSLYRDWDSQRVERYVFDYLRDRGYLSAGAQPYADGADNALSLEFRAGILQVRSELNLFGTPGVDRALFTEI